MKAEKRINSKRRAKQGYVDVTEAEYQSSPAKGLDEETLLKPGRHKFIRGGFKKMHPDYNAKTAKVKISIYIHKDVLNHFCTRAEAIILAWALLRSRLHLKGPEYIDAQDDHLE
ncbi:MAG: hypothetical protein KF868_10690 [Acidobacteria bacterium]|nr:hypothetical protein [Acidobacteriota bacterium]